MTEEISQIAERLKGLRTDEGISLETMARECGVAPEQFAGYESGRVDIPVGILHTASRRLGVELTSLLTGEEPKLRRFCLTRKGKGVDVRRTAAYKYHSLAYNFVQRKAEPFIVTVEPKPEGTPLSLNNHPGQEFEYVLSGKVRFMVQGTEILLEEGDSLYLDSTLQHGLQAVGGRVARLLAILV
jgi:transcriptional regulator with XRE-family HTH domain